MEWQVRVILFTLLINIVWIIQVLRALHIRPTTQMLSDILSRLVETVAEQGEDMQVCQLYMALYDTKWQSKCKHTCCIRDLFRDQNNMQYGGLKHDWKIVMNIHVPINNLKLHDFVQQTADARSDTDGIQSLKSKSALKINEMIYRYIYCYFSGLCDWDHSDTGSCSRQSGHRDASHGLHEGDIHVHS